MRWRKERGLILGDLRRKEERFRLADVDVSNKIFAEKHTSHPTALYTHPPFSLLLSVQLGLNKITLSAYEFVFAL